MTADEFKKLVEETCYGIDGMLDREAFKQLLLTHLPHIPEGERFACYGAFVYLPEKDLRWQSTAW